MAQLGDSGMQNIALAAVVTDGEKVPEQEMLPTTPDHPIIDEIRQETQKNDPNNSNSEAIEEDYNETVARLEGERPWWKVVGSVVLFTILAFLPVIFVSISADYEAYPLGMVKGPSSILNSYQEFWRWTLFIVLCIDFLVLCQLVFRPLPKIIIGILSRVQRKLTRTETMAIVCIRYCTKYLGYALAFIFIFWLADAILYEPTRHLAAKQVFAMLSPTERVKAKQLLLGDNVESFLAAAFIFSLWIAMEKYFVAAIRASFHRMAIGPRATICNKKFEVLGMLYRNRGAHATLSMANLETSKGGISEDTTVLSSDKGMDLNSVTRAKNISEAIFKTLCPADRTCIIADDMKPFLPAGEHVNAFRMLDTNRNGELNREDFRSAVLAIYEERFQLARSIISNDHIVEKLDWTLLVIFGLLGLLFSLVIYNHQGYSWVTSISTFILGFSFLFQTTMTKVFDTFLFVFVEHAYDVSDNVLIDNERLLVQQVEIFTTIFERADGTILYSPNASLKGKTIYNRQRMASEEDEVNVSFDAATEMGKLIEIRTKLGDYLTETYNEFTGAVSVNVLQLAKEGRAKIKIEAKYRPKADSYRSDEQLKVRRKELESKVKDICADLAINFIIDS